MRKTEKLNLYQKLYSRTKAYYKNHGFARFKVDWVDHIFDENGNTEVRGYWRISFKDSDNFHVLRENKDEFRMYTYDPDGNWDKDARLIGLSYYEDDASIDVYDGNMYEYCSRLINDFRKGNYLFTNPPQFKYK